MSNHRSYIKVYHTHRCYYEPHCHNRDHYHNYWDGGDIFSYMGSYGGGCCHGGYSFGNSFWSGFGMSIGMGIANMVCGFIGGLINPYPQYNNYSWDSYGLGYGSPGDSYTSSNTGNSFATTYPVSAKYQGLSGKKNL